MLDEIIKQNKHKVRNVVETSFLDDEPKISNQNIEIEPIEKLKLEEPKKVSLFSFFSDFQVFIQYIKSSFSKTDGDLEVINRNIWRSIEESKKVLEEIKNIPSLQLKLQDLELEIAEKKKEISELESFVEEETNKKNILREAAEHITEQDLLSLIEEGLIAAVKSLRNGEEEDFSLVKEKILDLQTKLDDALDKSK